MIGPDGTHVRLKGKYTDIEVVVDAASGELLGLAIIVSENHDEIICVTGDVAADVDAEVLVSDDHGAYLEFCSYLSFSLLKPLWAAKFPM